MAMKKTPVIAATLTLDLFSEYSEKRSCTKPLRGSLPIAHLTCAAHVGRMAART